MYLFNSACVDLVLKRWGFYALGSRLKRGISGVSEESESEVFFPELRLRFGSFFLGCTADVVVSGATATVRWTVRTS